MRIKTTGHVSLLKDKGLFFISNHMGYLDGVVLGSLIPAVFISKKEVQSWPLFGWVVTISGTIFINRQNKGSILKTVEEIAACLRDQNNILIFPEGTSTDGTKVLPFQPSVFAACLKNGTRIVPIRISYTHVNGRPISPPHQLSWYGQVPFHRHLWTVLAHRQINVEVHVLDAVETTRFPDSSPGRAALAETCRNAYLPYFEPSCCSSPARNN